MAHGRGRYIGMVNTSDYISGASQLKKPGYAHGPVRNLMGAILFDAVQLCMEHRVTHVISDEVKEAKNWISRRDKEYLFSFDNVCEALGLNPEELRYGIANAINSQTFEWRKMRRVS